jgi:hypothetical protein
MRINTIGKWPKVLTPQKTRYPNEPLQKYVVSASQTKYLSKNAEYFDRYADIKTLLNPGM